METITPSEPLVVSKPVNNIPYVIAVVVMIVIAVMAITLVEVLHEGDNTGTIAAIIGILTPTTLSLLAFMKAQETHLSVNSRLDGFIKNADAAARSQGVAQGIAEGTLSANKRTDQLGKEVGDGVASSGDIASPGKVIESGDTVTVTK